jgi:tripartite-type tricarboxylate transporter receptor subunit TctC
MAVTVAILGATMRRLLCTLFAAVMFVTAAQAQTTKIVVPFAAGGPVDQLGRLLAGELASRLGGEVIVDNRGGAGGIVGTELVARAAGDGSTILLASLGSHVISPILKEGLSYDPLNAFAPVVLVGSVPSLLVAGPKLGVTTLAELIAKAKAGQSMSYGSAGPGSTMNISGEMLNAAAGLKVTHVPYKGAAPALTDLQGGHIDMINADFPVLLPLVTNGAVKPLALLGTQRSPLLPNVPTTAELGYPDVVMENWYGIFLPANASPDVQAKLEKAVLEVLQVPAVKVRLNAGGTRGTLDRAAFKTKLAADFGYWRAAVKKLGINGE